MSFCPNCGSNLPEGTVQCPNCHTSVHSSGSVRSNQPTQTVSVPPQPTQPSSPPYYSPTPAVLTPVIPPEYRPLGAWAYFGWGILFTIPLVGLILLIVFALGGTRNINLRNYARSYFCWLAILLIIVAILALCGVFTTGFFAFFHS